MRNQGSVSNKLLSVFLVISIFANIFSPLTVLAAPRSTPFSPGQTLDPGAESTEPCGPTDANCFVSTGGIYDEGVISTTSPKRINFIGSGVAVTSSEGTTTVSISGSGISGTQGQTTTFDSGGNQVATSSLFFNTARTATFVSGVNAASTTITATTTTQGLFASFASILSSVISNLVATVANITTATIATLTNSTATIYNATIGALTATSTVDIYQTANVANLNATSSLASAVQSTLASTTAYGRLIVGNILATSTATSTFGGNLAIGGTGTSTSAGGLNLTGGCLAVNGSCVGSGSSLTGSTGQIAYFSGSNTAVGTSTIYISTNGSVGVGSSTLIASSTFGGTTTTQPFIVYGDIVSKGMQWTAQKAATENQWNSVAYGNGLFVAVSDSGSGNRVMTSPDGVNWTSRTSTADLSWKDVVYGNGLFVAVANDGTGNGVMTSPDGVNWTSRVPAQDNQWFSITYGKGTFVAVSNNGSNRVMTSRDGITWTARNAATVSDWISVTYGNGQFVAVANSGTTRVMTSPDGITWTGRTASLASILAVTYGNGLFVAVGDNGTGSRVMTSPDGIAWTSRASASDDTWSDVTYGNGLFIAVASSGGTGNTIMTSSDGIVWSSRTPVADNNWSSITYGNGIFVSVANSGDGNRVMTSGRSESTISPHDNIYQGALSFLGGVGFGTTTNIFGGALTQGVTLNNALVLASSTALSTTTSALYNNNGTLYWNGSAVGGSSLTGLTGQLAYFSGSNTAVGTSTISIAANGNVGIGNNNTNPLGSLHIRTSDLSGGYNINGDDLILENADNAGMTIHSGDSGVSGIYFGNSTSNLLGQVKFDNSAGALIFGTGNTERVRITNKGNFGIATDTPSSIANLTLATTTTAQLSLSAGSGKAQTVFRNDGTSLYIATTTLEGTATTSTSALEIALGGFGTTTVRGLNIVGQATTTSNVGMNITSGCFSVNGTCISGGGASLTGSTGQIAYFSGSNTAVGTSTISIGTNGQVGLGNSLFVASSTFGGTTTTPPLVVYGDIVSKGVTWTVQQSPTSNFWKSITYGNGQFVAVGDTVSGNGIMTSSDGVNWTARTSVINNTWSGVTFGNGLFVAVSLGGAGGNPVMTSSDGINWTQRTSVAEIDWRSVTYGNGLFVAVASSGTGNRVMTSPDGITWTTRSSAADNSWQSVTYGNGLFVAVSSDGAGNRVMTSPDGITWTVRTSAADSGWQSVTYGNGLFVAVAWNGTVNDQIMTSPNGINWTLRTSPANNQWYGVTYGNGLFVAVAESGTGNRVMTSPDGIIWTARSSASNNDWSAVTYGNGLFVAVAESGSGNRVMTSGKIENTNLATNNILQGIWNFMQGIGIGTTTNAYGGALTRGITLGYSTVNGTNIANSLVIHSATSSANVSTSTNALYSVNGALYFNGNPMNAGYKQMGYGESISAGDLVYVSSDNQVKKISLPSIAGTSHAIQSTGSLTTVDTSNAYTVILKKLDDSTVIMGYTDNVDGYSYLRIGQVNGLTTTWGGRFQASTNANDDLMDIVTVPSYSSTKVLLVFGNTSAPSIRYSFASISGTSISIPSSSLLANPGATPSSVKGAEIASNKVAVAYVPVESGSAGKVYACTIASDALTCGSAVALPTANASSITSGNRAVSIAKAATDKVVISYHYNTTFTLKIVSASVSGTAVTMGTNSSVFDSTNTYMSLTYSGVDNKPFFNTLYAGSNIYWGYFDTTDINGMSSNYSSTVATVPGGTAISSTNEASVALVDSTRLVIGHMVNTGNLSFRVATTTGSYSGSAGSELMPYANMSSTTVSTTGNINASNLSIVSMGSNGVIVVAFSDTGSSNDIVSRNYQLGAASGGINAGGTYGIARETLSANATGTVALFGSIVTGLSGLTPGTLYYVNTSTGGLTTTANSYVVGRAISTTELNTNLAFNAGTAQGTNTQTAGTQINDSDSNTFITTNYLNYEEDILRFFTAGAQRMLVTAAGLVGIGGTGNQPTAQLHVAATTTESATNLALLKVGNNFRINGDSSLTQTGTSTLATTTVAGRLGVGTTTPTGTLVVNGTTETLFQVASSTNQNILILNSNGALGLGTSTPALNTPGSLSLSGSLFVGGSATSTIMNGLSVGGTSGLTVQSGNGAVGIGTTTNAYGGALTTGLTLNNALVIASSTSLSTTTNALYSVNGTLYWNGSAVGSGGGGTNSIQNVTASTTASGWNYTVYVDTTAGSIVLTLPTASGNSGKRITVIKITSDSNTVVVDPNSSETVNGQSTYAQTTAYGSVTYESNGTNVFVVEDAQESYVASEYGEQVMSSNVTPTSGQTSSSNAATLITFTLPSAGVWEVTSVVRAYNSTAGGQNGSASTGLYDNGGTLVANSEVFVNFDGTGSVQGTHTGTGVTRITTTGSATYTLRGWNNSGNTDTAFESTVDGRTKVTWQKISGNAPVTGQMVDSVQFKLAADSSAFGSNTLDIPQGTTVTTVSGNIPVSSAGVITLTAGKTYQFDAQVRVAGGANMYLAYTLVDATTDTQITNAPNPIAVSTEISGGANTSGAENFRFIYTPTTNQTVQFRSTAVGSNPVINAASSYFTVTQLGSSAITSESMVAVGGNILGGSYTSANTLQIGTLNSGALQLITGSSTRLHISETGYMGIGTTTPSSVVGLTIASSTASQLALSAGAGVAQWTFRNAGGTLYFSTTTVAGTATTTTSALTMLSNGNVGIGTSSPNASLDVRGSGSNILSLSTSAGANALTVLSNGFVGIGTTSPAEKFVVVGNVVSDDTSTHSLKLKLSGVDKSQFGVVGTAGQIAANTSVGDSVIRTEGGKLFFDTNSGVGTAAMTILGANGNIGIGTISPNVKMFVTDSKANDYVLKVQNTNNSAGAQGIELMAGSNSLANSYIMRFLRPDTTEIGKIVQDSVTSVSYTTTSDRREKENIATTSRGLSDLMNIQVADFNFSKDPSQKKITGFIAQDLYLAFPDAVVINGDDGLVPLSASSSPWSVDYGRVTPLLVRAVQEQQLLLGGFASSTATSTTSAISAIPGLRSIIDEVKEESAPNVVDVFVAKVTSGTRFLTDFVVARITAMRGYFDEVFARKVNTKELCVGKTCVTETELQNLLNNKNNSASAVLSGSKSENGNDNASSSGSSTPKVSIKISGDNPAVIEVGQSYADLGATMDTLDSALKALGIRTYVEDKEVDAVTIDTSAEGTHKVVYRVVGADGETLAEEARVVKVNAVKKAEAVAEAPAEVPEKPKEEPKPEAKDEPKEEPAKPADLPAHTPVPESTPTPTPAPVEPTPTSAPSAPTSPEPTPEPTPAQ